MPGDDQERAALFHRDGASFVPSIYAQGPWDPRAQFGGSPAALMVTLVDQAPALVPMQVARFTVDLLRPVPLAPLVADVRVVREGKRIQVVSASLLAEGTEVARATGLRLRRTELHLGDLPEGREPNPLPTEPRSADAEPFPVDPPGSRRAVEYLHQGVGGHYRSPAWVRLLPAVIEGEPVRPVARLAYVADLASGIDQPRGLPVRGINADLTLNVVRDPVGEWLCLDGRGWISRSGVGQVQATLRDTCGTAASVSMARLVDPAP